MTADRLGFLARLAFRRLFVGAAQLHLAEYALALHFLFQRLQGLVDIVVADCDVNDGTSPVCQHLWVYEVVAAYIIGKFPCEGAFVPL